MNYVQNNDVFGWCIQIQRINRDSRGYWRFYIAVNGDADRDDVASGVPGGGGATYQSQSEGIRR